MLVLEVIQVTSYTLGRSNQKGLDMCPRGRKAERYHPHWIIMMIKGLNVYKVFGRAPGTLLHTYMYVCMYVYTHIYKCYYYYYY